MPCPMFFQIFLSNFHLHAGRIGILGLSSILGIATNVSAQGGSSASPVLQRNVTQTVMIADMAIDRECRQRKVAGTEVIEVSADGKSGTERWTLERCGKLVTYRVTFSPSSRGGTDFSVRFEK